MTGIEAVSINLKFSKHCHSCITRASFYISYIIAYLSSIFKSVIARSISLDSNANPVVKDPNNITCGDWLKKTS
jgi:hypothetical protein